MAKRKPTKAIQIFCRDCDGCGWVEGGKVLQTTCKTCNGTGFELAVEQAGARREKGKGSK